MKKWSRGISFIFILFLLTFQMFGQTKEELEKRRKQKEEEIRVTKKLLEETDKKQKQSVEFLNVLNTQIHSRESLINTVNQEISYLDDEISDTKDVINSLEGDLKSLKKEYASMVRFAYKTRNTYSRLGFIFSAPTFNQSYKRLKLLQNYSQYRKKQIQLIKQTKSFIELKLNQLDVQKTEKVSLVTVHNSEKATLEKDKESQSMVLAELKKQEGKLRKELKEKEKLRDQLNREIDKLIREEIARSSKTTSGTTKAFEMTPEMGKLSIDFTSNKGKLPWPVEKGVVSEVFGEHEHPTLEGVTVVCNGTKFITNKNADTRAVFNGVVQNIITIPGAGKTVLINHGEFFTVYTNLEEVYVQTGNKVTTKQKLGRIRYDKASGKTETELQIWKMTVKQNPEYWIYRK